MTIKKKKRKKKKSKSEIGKKGCGADIQSTPKSLEQTRACEVK